MSSKFAADVRRPTSAWRDATGRGLVVQRSGLTNSVGLEDFVRADY